MVLTHFCSTSLLSLPELWIEGISLEATIDVRRNSGHHLAIGETEVLWHHPRVETEIGLLGSNPSSSPLPV